MVHYCFNDSYPGGKVVCLCRRGVDHPEDLFDVPIEEKEEESP